jgi:hypothetical protein
MDVGERKEQEWRRNKSNKDIVGSKHVGSDVHKNALGRGGGI